MSNDTQSTFEQLCQHTREVAMLESIEELLGWDERTQLPAGAGEYRADQMAYLSGLTHQKQTDPRIGKWLEELNESSLSSDPNSDIGATIRQINRGYTKAVKLPQSLVEQITKATVLGQQHWAVAREKDDFSLFEPQLKEIVELQQQKAAALGFEDVAYDALLDEYEPDAKTAETAEVLLQLRNQLVPLVESIVGAAHQPDESIIVRDYPIEGQERFGKQVAAEIGFDFNRGRLDVTHHPFCTGLGPNDCRITTRYDRNYFPSAFFGILHEAGHGIYDQGLRTDWYGLPPGSFLSLGIHESQSRLWENLVGRSRAFWDHYYNAAQKTFPDALSAVNLDDFHFAINKVKPSLIRVEADEVTYNLHILIRFELEKALICDELQVADLPAAWNDKYQSYLGITPPSDADGVLQDIHWSAGLFGYFPTYSLGNLYASQFFDQAEIELGSLSEQFTQGSFEPLRKWLNEKVHQSGQCHETTDLIQRVTGSPLSSKALMKHLQGTFGKLYRVS